MPDEDKKRAAHRALVDRVLNGEGRSSAQQRAQAFGNADMPPPLGTLISKVAAGVSRQQVEDALAVCAAFNTTDRLADAFGFDLLSPEGFEAGAKYLLKRGYR